MIPLQGTPFEDVIDGYFPLRESLRQMLVRQNCDAALVVLSQAPAMEIPGLAPTDPVPLYITDGFGCLIHTMTLMVRLVNQDASVSGVADWSWWDGHRANDTRFSELHRLAEPAFLRGLRLRGDPAQTGQCLLDSDSFQAGKILRGHSKLGDQFS